MIMMVNLLIYAVLKLITGLRTAALIAFGADT